MLETAVPHISLRKKVPRGDHCFKQTDSGAERTSTDRGFTMRMGEERRELFLLRGAEQRRARKMAP